MNSVQLNTIVSLLNNTLSVQFIQDSPMAINGLQVENNGRIHKVALAVDATQKTLDDAVEAGADLLIVHHGIFWCGLRPIVGWWRRKIETCLHNNLAVYSAHLPLDVHQSVGNNICIARELGLLRISTEMERHGIAMAVSGIFNGSVGELRELYARITDSAVTGNIVNPDAPAGRVIISSGSAGPEIYRVQEKGFDTFLTGEQNHWVLNAARDMRMNVLFAGHYATETFGVKAVGAMLHERYDLPTVFLHNPTRM